MQNAAPYRNVWAEARDDMATKTRQYAIGVRITQEQLMDNGVEAVRPALMNAAEALIKGLDNDRARALQNAIPAYYAWPEPRLATTTAHEPAPLTDAERARVDKLEADVAEVAELLNGLIDKVDDADVHTKLTAAYVKLRYGN